MICKLSDELITIIFKKLHRFNYLDNLFYVNKELNNKTKNIYNFHYSNINKYLNISSTNNFDNTSKIYRLISKHLFNNKILNVRKINDKYKNLPVNNMIKLLIICNEYFMYNINYEYIKIISYKEILEPFKDSMYDLNYIPFIMFNLNNKFYIFVEFCYNKNLYRLRIKSIISNTNVGLYKNVTEKDILNILTLSKNQLLTKYV